MWNLLFIPMLAILFLIIYLDTLIANKFDTGRDDIKYIASFGITLLLSMVVVVSSCVVMSAMTSPVLTDSVYDKIAIEMYYND